MLSWPVTVTEKVLNLKFLALGASQVLGLLASRIRGHFWFGELGGLRLRKGRVRMGPVPVSSPGSSEQQRLGGAQVQILIPIYLLHDIRLVT